MTNALIQDIEARLKAIEAFIELHDAAIRQGEPIFLQQLEEQVSFFYKQLAKLPQPVARAYLAPMRKILLRLNEWVSILESQKHIVKKEISSIAKHLYASRAYQRILAL